MIEITDARPPENIDLDRLLRPPSWWKMPSLSRFRLPIDDFESYFSGELIERVPEQFTKFDHIFGHFKGTPKA